MECMIKNKVKIISKKEILKIKKELKTIYPDLDQEIRKSTEEAKNA